jgi:uncharacterized protein YdhG (YjbR/CyaY superfamily)
MQSQATSIAEYIKELPADRRDAITKLRKVIKKNLPEGFKEVISYGMIGYVVPHQLYPKGYHVDPSAPLPFINLASQKNNIALYHMGIYGDKKLLEWFTKEWTEAGVGRLDMGKSCIRFHNPEKIPFGLIGQLAGKINVDTWIKTYEKNRK